MDLKIMTKTVKIFGNYHTYTVKKPFKK